MSDILLPDTHDYNFANDATPGALQSGDAPDQAAEGDGDKDIIDHLLHEWQHDGAQKIGAKQGRRATSHHIGSAEG